MNKLARVRRINSERNVDSAAVNVANVRYVYAQSPGAYIAFQDHHDPNIGVVTPVGMHSPDPVEEVIKRLNRPYWLDLLIKVGSLTVATAAVMLAIIFGSSGSG